MKLLESTRKEVRSNEEKYLHSKEAIEDQIKVCLVQLMYILIRLIAWGSIIKEGKRNNKSFKK